MSDKIDALRRAFDYLRRARMEIPIDIYIKGLRVGAIKAAGDLSSITSRYNDSIIEAAISYFDGGSLVAARKSFRRAMVEAFGSAVDLGWTESGGELPIDEDVLSWFNARISEEIGYIDMLFEQMKQLKKEPEFDYFAWASARADGYTGTLREIYNYAKLSLARDMMVTFDGEDGKESCPDCQKYKGKRHRVSWFMARDAVPPYGSGLECHRGGQCQHGLMDDKGNWVTV